MDKFALARKLELLATSFEKEAKMERTLATGDDPNFSDGLAHAYESAARSIRKLTDESFYGTDKYGPAKHAILAFIHAGQPWPLTDATMERILDAEDRALVAKTKRA